MNSDANFRPAEILLIEDNPGDIRLTEEALKESKLYNKLKTVTDGVEAMKYLLNEGEHANAPKPDIILLDLNLPKKDGREVLEEIKQDERLKTIPIVILTTSNNEEDIIKTYNLHANCYVTKPVDFEEFTKIVLAIHNFWFSIVKLPQE